MKKRIGIIGFGEMGKRHALEFYEATMGIPAASPISIPVRRPIPAERNA